MQVKYASRHALYPVPNVSDCTDVAARARRAVDSAEFVVAERAVDATTPAAARAARGAALFTVVRDCALRAVLAVVVVALRATAARPDVPVTVFADVARAETVLPDVRPADTTPAPADAVVRRATVVLCVVAARFTADASRTAASANPTPHNNIAQMVKTFFIIFM